MISFLSLPQTNILFHGNFFELNIPTEHMILILSLTLIFLKSILFLGSS